MANHQINIILRAKNRIAAGLASAQGSVQAFSKSLKTMISASLGPIAAVIGAFMLLKKIIGWVQSAVDAKNKAMREGDEIKAKAATEALAKSYDQLTKAIALRNEAIKNGQKVADIELKGTRALIAAQRELAKQQEMRGVDPADKAAIDAVNAKYAEMDATEKAAQKEADLMQQRRRLMDEAASSRQEAIALAKEEEKQSRKASELARQAQQYAQQSSSSKFRATHGKEAAAEAAAAGKAAQDAADAIVKQYQKTREAKNAALTAAIQAEKEAAAMTSEIQAAGLDKLNLTLEQQTAAAQKAAQERVEAERKAADEIQKIRDDIAKAEDDRQKELDAQHDAHQKKQLANELAANQEKLAAAKDLSKKKIADFIAEAQQKKADAKEEARDAAKEEELEGQLKRGTKLSKKEQEWLDARKAIKGAGKDVVDLEKAGADIRRQQDLLNAQDQIKALQNIEGALNAHNIKLDNLLHFGG